MYCITNDGLDNNRILELKGKSVMLFREGISKLTSNQYSNIFGIIELISPPFVIHLPRSPRSTDYWQRRLPSLRVTHVVVRVTCAKMSGWRGTSHVWNPTLRLHLPNCVPGCEVVPSRKSRVSVYLALPERVPFCNMPRGGTYHWYSYFLSHITEVLTCDFRIFLFCILMEELFLHISGSPIRVTVGDVRSPELDRFTK